MNDNENNNNFKSRCVSFDQCKQIMGPDFYNNTVALFNIGWLVSNAILEAGEMIAEAIKSNKEAK